MGIVVSGDEVRFVPGRKTWGQHRAIRQEVERLDDRLEHLAAVEASAKKPFARMLARDHAERVRARLDTIVKHWRRPAVGLK